MSRSRIQVNFLRSTTLTTIKSRMSSEAYRVFVTSMLRKTWVLTEEGKRYAAQGSPEVQLFLAVPEEGNISVFELKKKLGESIDSFAWKYAKENKWVEMEKKQVSRKVQHVDDVVQALLLQIQEGKEIDEDGIVFLKGRKNHIELVKWNGYSSIKKGPNYAPERKKVSTDLTRESLLNWKELRV